MRVSQQVIDSRRQEIARWLGEAGFSSLAELCARFAISEATARRDLSALENSGLVRRTHGGALGEYNRSFASFQERMQRNAEGKERVAARAVRLVAEGMTVFLDPGTTLVRTARHIGEAGLRNVRVVTNNLSAAQELSNFEGIRVILVGGEFLNRQSTLLGDYAVRFVSEFHFDLALLGAEGVTAEGVWNSSPEIVVFQKSVVRASHRTALCIDASKLSIATPFQAARTSELNHIVSDASESQLLQHGIPMDPARWILA